MQDMEWHDAPAQRMPANDNTSLRIATDRHNAAGPWQSAHAWGAGARAVPGRTADVVALIAVLLWQISFLALLFVLM